MVRDRLRTLARLESHESHLAAVCFVRKRVSISEVGAEPFVVARGSGFGSVFSSVDLAGLGVDASLLLLDVAVNLDGIDGVTAVGVDPVHAILSFGVVECQLFAGFSWVLFGSLRQEFLLDDSGSVDKSLQSLVVSQLLGNVESRLVRCSCRGSDGTFRARLEESLKLSSTESTTSSSTSWRSWGTSGTSNTTRSGFSTETHHTAGSGRSDRPIITRETSGSLGTSKTLRSRST